jgi:NADP-dependent 3-hydroxy acid dehydrogenase YdfG
VKECDVTSRQSVQAFVDAACEHYQVSSLTSMVAVAGVMYFTEMKNCLMDQWDQTIDVNCKGVTNSIGAVLPKMVASKAGKIVIITSDAGVRQFPNLAVYCASKHFVETLCEITRRELVGTGVTLHTIQPGDVKGTELILKNSDQSAADKMGVTIGQPVGEGFTREQLLDPADVASAVTYVLTAPPHVAVNSILIEARDQE